MFSSCFSRNFLALDVYYGELIYELIEQQPSYTITDAFSKYTYNIYVHTCSYSPKWPLMNTLINIFRTARD